MADANLNRAAEGLRVAEDVLRFVYASARLSAEARSVRHATSRAAIAIFSRPGLLDARDARSDVGARRVTEAMRRKHPRDLLFANLRRAEESLRVLEEAARYAGGTGRVRNLQELRFRIYELEARSWRMVSGTKRSTR